MRYMSRKAKIAFLSSMGFGLSALSSLSNAALDAAITTAIDGIETNITDILAAYWPIYLLATGGFVLVKLFKRGASKV